MNQSLRKGYLICLGICLLSLNAIPLLAQTKFFAPRSTTDKLPKAVEKTQNIRKISVVQLNEAALRSYLQAAPLEFHNNGVTLPLEVPLPNGTTEMFGLVESPVLSPEQAALHPEIKTYTGNGVKNKKYVIRLSLTSSGFNAIILNVEDDAVYFEPYSTTDPSLYFSYFSKDAFIPKDQRHLGEGCGVGSLTRANGSVNMTGHTAQTVLSPDNNTGATLRTYRLAIAATGEFTEVHAGADNAAKKTSSYNDIVTYVNRMNAVYRNEICVTFSLVSGESIVYPDKTTDPYNHASSSDMLGQCKTDLTTNVGATNYDVGHVIGQSSGSGEGLALSGVACGDDKAQGVTKIGGAPYAQVFFDQTLFHEVGHQFSMSHSYNSSIPVCTTRNQPTSVEPGAGATIMSYGFTCDGDDYFTSTTNGPILVFHTINYSEMFTYMTANVCGTTTATGNNVPVVTEPSNYTVPKSTPFALAGTATDADNDALTYCWEGTNTGEAAAPDATTLANTAKPPFFRTYAPAASGDKRSFPLLSAVLDGSNYAKGDKLPSVAIATTHRLTVRDNRASGGGTAYKTVTVTVNGTAGPFLETTNLSASYVGNSTQTITWSVNGTDQAPISCANVKISLSTDGGTTFPTVLLASTPNDGTEAVTLPNTATTTARIKVEAIGNVFYDISNSNFTITTSLPVELLDLQVKANGNTARVVWFTASEKNNFGYEVERSIDGQTFEKVGFVKALGASQNQLTYNFTDASLISNTYYYRLKQIDTDGKFAYSKTVSVLIGKNKSSVQIYPTYTEGVLFIKAEDVKIDAVSVFNSVGQLMFTTTSTNRLDLSQMPSGMYLVQVQAGSMKIVEKVFKKS